MDQHDRSMNELRRGDELENNRPCCDEYGDGYRKVDLIQLIARNTTDREYNDCIGTVYGAPDL
jgi:hypothetical protein